MIYLSGIYEGKTLGTPIAFMIKNKDSRPEDYDEIKDIYRPSHADYTYQQKYGYRDYRGGGRSSARALLPCVVAGAIAKQYLAHKGVNIHAYTRSIGDVVDNEEHCTTSYGESTSFKTRAMSQELDSEMTQTILDAGKDEDSIGGTVQCAVTGLPIGFGGEWFDALDVSIARMMFSIPAVKGVEFGKGFDITKMRGSQSNDQYIVKDGKITSETNNMGGVTGGLSNGMPLVFRVAIKPTPSIAKEQRTVNLETMTTDTVSVTGRHDPCIVPRIIPVVEAMTALVLADFVLLQRCAR